MLSFGIILYLCCRFNQKTSLPLPKTSQVQCMEQNSDQRSCITPNESKQRKDADTGSLTVSPEEGLVFDTSPDDSVKLKLNRKRSKRSRYSEVNYQVVPINKSFVLFDFKSHLKC